jgi:hypothetical protein
MQPEAPLSPYLVPLVGAGAMVSWAIWSWVTPTSDLRLLRLRVERPGVKILKVRRSGTRS